MTVQERGRFLWHELNTTDVAASERFYRAVTGWGILPFAHDPAYRMWTAGDAPQGGVMALTEDARAMGAPPHWLTYIGVTDVDAAVALATALGAHVHVAPEDIPGAGRFAVLADPQGAVFAVHTASQPMDDAPPALGGFSWHELATTDPDRAWAFYSALFGWRKTTAMDMGAAMGTYQMFGRDRRDEGGIYGIPKGMQAPPSWLPYIKVASVDRAVPTVVAEGGQVLNGPMDVPGGDRVAVCMDPQGAVFALHASPPARAVKAPEKAKAKAAPRRAASNPMRKPKVVERPTPKAASKPGVKANPPAKAKGKAGPGPKTKVAAKPKPKPKPKPKAKAKAKAKPRPKARTVAKAKASGKGRPGPKAPAKPRRAPKAKAKVKPVAKPRRATRARVKVKPGRSTVRRATRPSGRPKGKR